MKRERNNKNIQDFYTELSPGAPSVSGLLGWKAACSSRLQSAVALIHSIHPSEHGRHLPASVLVVSAPHTNVSSWGTRDLVGSVSTLRDVREAGYIPGLQWLLAEKT